MPREDTVFFDPKNPPPQRRVLSPLEQLVQDLPRPASSGNSPLERLIFRDTGVTEPEFRQFESENAPNEVEQIMAGTLGKVMETAAPPGGLVHNVLDKVTRPFVASVGGLRTAMADIKGDHEEATRIAQRGFDVFTGRGISDPKFAEFTMEAALGDLGMPRSNMRTLLGLGLDLAVADPVMHLRLGGPTRKARGIIKEGGRLQPTAHSRALAGEQAAVQFAGTPLLPRRASAAILGRIERAGDVVRTRTALRHLTTKGKASTTRAAAVADASAGITVEVFRREGRALAEAIEETGKKRGITAEQAWAQADLAAETKTGRTQIREMLEGVERTPDGTRAARVRESILDQHAALVDQYIKDGHTAGDAIFAARQVILNPGVVDPAFAPFGASMRRFGERIAKLIDDHGGDLQRLDDPDLYYVGRVLTQEARDRLGGPKLFKFKRFIRKKYYGWDPFSTKRKEVWQGKSIPEINAWIKKNAPDVWSDMKGNLFEVDPEQIFAGRAMGARRFIAAGTFLEETLNDFAKPASDALASQGWRRVTGKGLKEQDDLLKQLGLSPKGRLANAGDLMVPGELFDDIRTVGQRWRSTDAGEIYKTIRDVTQIWKTSVTVPFIAFHIRNFISNIWANFLKDVNPLEYGPALRDMVQMARGKTTGIRQYGAFKGTLEDLMQELIARKGLKFGGMALEDLGKTTTSALFEPLVKKGQRAAKPRALLRNIAPTVALTAAAGGFAPLLLPRLGRNVGEFIESWAKLTHVIDKLKKGFSMDDAVLSMKEALFDYGDITPFERRYMKNLVPFYVWMRKNLPLQVKALVTKPGKFAVVQHTRQALNTMLRDEDERGPVDVTLIPDFMTRGLFAAGKGSGDNINFIGTPGLGFEDFSMFDRNLGFDAFMASVNPLLKAPLQGVLNKEFFRDRPLSELGRSPASGITQTFWRVMPDWFKELTDYSEIRDDNGDLVATWMNPQWLNAFRAFPGLSASTRTLNVAGQVSNQDRPGAPLQPMRVLTGVRVQNISPERQAQNLMFYMLDEVDVKLEKLESQGVVVRRERFDITPSLKRSLRGGQIVSPRDRALKKKADEWRRIRSRILKRIGRVARRTRRSELRPR